MEEHRRAVSMRKHRRCQNVLPDARNPGLLELRPLVASLVLVLDEALTLVLPHAPEAEKLKG